MENQLWTPRKDLTVADYSRGMEAVARKPVKAFPLRERVSAEVLAEIDQLVHDAYCAGVNQKEGTKPETSGLKHDTTMGPLALKAILWCQHVGTR